MREYRGNIFLIGFMGCGKSTVSVALADMLDARVLEMDEEIVREEGMAISEIFDKKGEAYFRSCETRLLQNLDVASCVVVSCGGGVATREENIRLMKQLGKTVLLKATPGTILERIGGDDNRPLLKGRKTLEGIQQLMDARRSMYEAAAEIQVDTDDRTAAEIAAEIISKVAE